jgi:hypothetical protein
MLLTSAVNSAPPCCKRAMEASKACVEWPMVRITGYIRKVAHLGEFSTKYVENL